MRTVTARHSYARDAVAVFLIAISAVYPAMVGVAIADPPPNPPVTMSALSVDTPVVTPVGLAAATLTLSVHITSPLPISTRCIDGVVAPGDEPNSPASDGPYLRLERTSEPDPAQRGRAPSSAIVLLRHASGTATDGDWTASVAIPSTWSGTWQVRRVFACALDAFVKAGALEVRSGTELDADPTDSGLDVGFTVLGSHIPTLSVGFSPAVLPYNLTSVVQKGRLTDLATGAGIGGVPLYDCGFLECNHVAVVTDARGFYALKGPVLLSLWLPTPPPAGEFGAQHVSNVLFATTRPRVQPGLKAARMPQSVPVGAFSLRGVALGSCTYGQTYFDNAQRVWIQLRAGNGTWALDGIATIRDSRRWTAVMDVRPGKHVYRAYLQGCAAVAGGDAGSVSVSGRPFLVTGT